METLVICRLCNIPLDSPCSCSSPSNSSTILGHGLPTISPDDLLSQITELHGQISSLPSLYPSPTVNSLFSNLVSLCLLHSDISPESLPDPSAQEMRHSLICLCSEAEGLLEQHHAGLLGKLPEPHLAFDQFPYYGNYCKLAALEHGLLLKAATDAGAALSRIAFVGSGPMPLTSIVLATTHLTKSEFHNFDLDREANTLAEALVAGDSDLAPRMKFHTRDILEQKSLEEFDVVFLAALVGMDAEEKKVILAHLATAMRPGALLVVRSAHGARAFLYPVVTKSLLEMAGFHVLSIYHPSDEVVNSVIVALLPPSSSSSF